MTWRAGDALRGRGVVHERAADALHRAGINVEPLGDLAHAFGAVNESRRLF